MKTLKEIFEEKFEDFTPFIINEIFNTKIPVEEWQVHGNEESADLTVDEATFRIKIEHLTYTDTHDMIIPFVNVTFSRWDGKKYSEDLVMTTGAASKVLGAIMNALIDKIQKEKYQVIAFAALDNVDKRMKIYNSLASKVMKRYATNYSVIENLPISNGKISLLVRKDFDDENLDNVKNQILNK